MALADGDAYKQRISTAKAAPLSATASMHSLTATLLVLTVLLVLLPAETYAFGAGDIPDFAYLNGE